MAARTLQGAGAGLVLGAAPALVTLAVPPGRRSRALATFQLCTATGFAVGPPIGGLVLGRWSWPAVWWYRVPVALVLLGLVVWVARADRRAVGASADASPLGLAGAPGRLPGQPVPLDLPGVATLAVALAGLLLALSRGRELGWTSPPVLVSLVVGMVAAGAFVVIERAARRRSSTSRSCAGAASPSPTRSASPPTRPGSWCSSWCPTTCCPFAAWAPWPAGWSWQPHPSAWPSPRPRRAVWPGGPLGPLCAVGLGVEAAGLAGVSRLTPTTPMAPPWWRWRSSGSGVGLFQVPNQSFVMGSIPRSAQGVAGGITQTVRTVGVLLGVAGGGTIFEARTAAYTPSAASPEIPRRWRTLASWPGSATCSWPLR